MKNVYKGFPQLSSKFNKIYSKISSLTQIEYSVDNADYNIAVIFKLNLRGLQKRILLILSKNQSFGLEILSKIKVRIFTIWLQKNFITLVALSGLGQSASPTPSLRLCAALLCKKRHKAVI